MYVSPISWKASLLLLVARVPKGCKDAGLNELRTAAASRYDHRSGDTSLSPNSDNLRGPSLSVTASLLRIAVFIEASGEVLLLPLEPLRDQPHCHSALAQRRS